MEQQDNLSILQNELVKMVKTNAGRIRSLEQRLTNLEQRFTTLEEKMIEESESLKKDFDQIMIDIKAVSESVSKIRSEIIVLSKNIDKAAKRSEVKELESLLDLYSPIKSKFTTRDEVERLIEEKLEKKTQ